MLSAFRRMHCQGKWYILVNKRLMIQLLKEEVIKNFSISFIRYDHRTPNLVKGFDYIRIPSLNKGLAFTFLERQVLGIHGILAPCYLTLEEQIKIVDLACDRYEKPLNKLAFLNELADTNQRLFYCLLNSNIEKFLPIVYTPTVALFCEMFGHMYRKPKGLFLSILDKGYVKMIIANWPINVVRIVCITDGERILGLGDLGAYGMGIPIGKLRLYTALAGINPSQCLPITLDVGTNNESLLVDPMYIGIRQKRVTGAQYNEFIDEVMNAIIDRYGDKLLIQFEDFAIHNATVLLKRYQKKHCVFNDDIQGTAAVVVAGILAAVKLTNSKLADHTFMMLGAGSAGVGIANLVVDAMVDEGMKLEEARAKCFLYDIQGILTTKRGKDLPPHAAPFYKDLPICKDFEKAINLYRPTCLIGTSTVTGAFKPSILKQMATHTERPLIFALSNPTHKAECTAQEAYDNTEGRCIFASGSPFPPVEYKGKKYYTGQGNNAYIFPGLGLGVITAQVMHINDSLFLIAAKVVASMVTEKDFEVGRVYPPMSDIRKISEKIAIAVVAKAYEEKSAGVYPKPANIAEAVNDQVYPLEYPNYAPEIYDYPKHKYTVKSFEEVAQEFLECQLCSCLSITTSKLKEVKYDFIDIDIFL